MKSVWLIDADEIESMEEDSSNLLKINSVIGLLDDEKIKSCCKKVYNYEPMQQIEVEKVISLYSKRFE